MTVRVVRNPAGIAAFLKGPAATAIVEDVAQRVAARAKSLAPVDAQAEHPGEYRDSIRVIAEAPSDRARRAVGSDVAYALQVELKHGTLGKALDGG